MLVFFSLICSRLISYKSIGYDNVIINETVQIDLDYNNDYLFLLNNSVGIKIKTLDMIEYTEIKPGSNGFAGFFLTSVIIITKDNSLLQIYSLPTSYCNHHFISYVSDFGSRETMLWDNANKDFKFCLVNEKVSSEDVLDISFSSINSSCAYSKPENYMNGYFNGINIGKKARIVTENGLIIKINGGMHEQRSSFVVESESKNFMNQNVFKPITYYYTASTKGNNFLDIIDIRFKSKEGTKFKLDLNQKIGLSISVLIMLCTIILLIYNVKNINLKYQ